MNTIVSAARARLGRWVLSFHFLRLDDSEAPPASLESDGNNPSTTLSAGVGISRRRLTFEIPTVTIPIAHVSSTRSPQTGSRAPTRSRPNSFKVCVLFVKNCSIFAIDLLTVAGIDLEMYKAKKSSLISLCRNSGSH